MIGPIVEKGHTFNLLGDPFSILSFCIRDHTQFKTQNWIWIYYRQPNNNSIKGSCLKTHDNEFVNFFFLLVFRCRLCLTYSYSFIIILICHGIYVVFFVVISDITSPTLIITIYTNIILSIIIIIVIIIIINNNYWSVITVITSTTVITNIVRHIICAVTITIFNCDFKYNNIGNVTGSFLISPICTDSNCKITYPSNITHKNPTPIHWCRSETFNGMSVLIL